MKILAIDTSCDETAAAVTENTKVLSNIIWSQASLHAKFGGVMPSLAQRMHEERIDFVVNRALSTAHCSLATDIDAIAVTVGPGLAIALGVGIDRAKKLAKKYHKPLIPINHVEAHLLSPLVSPITDRRPLITFPAFGLVVSGGNTVLVKINKECAYEILAQTQDDALGEALDKAARMLGLGYPGGAILEKFAKNGNPKTYPLPVPLIGDKVKNRFSYSGLKTAMYRLVEKEKPLTKEKSQNLAASFQNTAFTHLIRVCSFALSHLSFDISGLLVGGGVSANKEMRMGLRKLGRSKKIKVWFPYSKKLCGDNAAMVGVAAYIRTKNEKLKSYNDLDLLDRKPRMEL